LPWLGSCDWTRRGNQDWKPPQGQSLLFGQFGTVSIAHGER